MNVKFYNNTSDNEEVKKTLIALNEGNTIPCKIYGDCSIQSPKLLLNMKDFLINANYIYIDKFNRYYYITDVAISNGTEVTISLKVDVLMSFWDEFKGSSCIAKRSTSDYVNYLQDDQVAFPNNIQYQTRRFNFNFQPTENGKNYMLTMGGTI